jgi:methylenetetrahydrofolate reductase (NADPH)
MKIIDQLSGSQPGFSFEYFPPKDAHGMLALFETIRRLKPYRPAFVSVTYGAGGSSRALTVELVRHIKLDTGIETMAHLTCLGATRVELGQVLDGLRDSGIENVLALRGDPPPGATVFERTPGGFAHASELVEFIRSNYDFCIAAACYPEKHVEAADLDSDLSNLKRKVDAGVDLLITQLFFDNRDYFDFVQKARAIGIEQPIIPGIMPVTSRSQLARFTAMCGAHIPAPLRQRLEAAGQDPEAVRRVGVEHATQQCRSLLAAGVPGIHLYTLNRSPATVQVLEAVR